VSFERALPWVREQMPVTAAAVKALPSLDGVRLACSMHLEVKMVPALAGFLEKGAQLFLTTCNPHTVDDATVAWAEEQGAKARAWRGMPLDAQREAVEQACLEFRPTHLCEMGAELSAFMLSPAGAPAREGVKAGLEATGSGTARLEGVPVPYPVFNWDDLPIKEGLHNRRMVGLVAAHAFFERTRLTFHNKRVLVVGYGLVGRSACDAARAYGGRVLVAERDPARALEARFGGEEVLQLEEALPLADVVITATGARHVIGAGHLRLLKAGAFLLNVGHLDQEIDLAALHALPREEVLPHLERYRLEEKPFYLFAGGSMANLTAGQGDSLNAFDITLAAMVAGVGFMVSEGGRFLPGMQLLPREAWVGVARAGLGEGVQVK
jgi:adenosylhomocysteinase